MSQRNKEFEQLLERVREGDEDASAAFVARFGPYILRIVRRKLHQKLRAKFDSADFVQAVWASFFGRLPDLDVCNSHKQLATYLAMLARSKTVDEFRRRMTQKLNLQREVSLEDCPLPTESPPDKPFPQRATPSEAAVANEAWDQLIKDRGDLSLRVLELRLTGATFTEIAQQLGVSDRTARRIVRRSQRRLGGEAGEVAGSPDDNKQ